MDDYELQFCTMAAVNGLNEVALLTAFCQGLNPEVCMNMANFDDEVEIENCIPYSIFVSQRLTACSPVLLAQLATAPPQAQSSVLPPAPSMDLDHLTKAEHQCCLSQK